MKIVFLTQYFPPEIGAPQARLSEMARHFMAAGHEVTILTAMPNYPTGIIQEGYGGFLKRETYFGAEVIRSFIYPTKKTSFLHRLSNYFSFVLSSAIVGTFLLKRADYIVVQSPPLFLGLSGLWLSLVKRTRMIFNVSDLWPESAVRVGVIREGGWLHRFSMWLEKLFYKRAYLITGQSRSTTENIRQRFAGYHVYHLSNGVDTTLFSPEHFSIEARQKLAPDAEFIVGYIGLHGLAQGLDQLLRAIHLLKDYPGMRFVFIGDGIEKQDLIALKDELQLENVTFHDPIPKAEIPALVASADAMFVPLKTMIPGAVPSKLYEAMASGKPSIVVASGEPAEIIEQSEGGIAVNTDDIEGIAEAVKRLWESPELRQDMGRKARLYAEEHYDRHKISANFIQYLQDHIEDKR